MTLYNIKAEKAIDSLIALVMNECALSKSRVQRLLKEKEIKVNGFRVNSDISLVAGDNISVYLADSEAQKLKMPILYQDDSIAVIIKPVGIESCGELSAEYRLSKQLDKEVFACHRLDYNTSGLNAFALDKNALDEITAAFKERRVEKLYIAEVCGRVKERDIIKGYLFKDAIKKTVYVTETKKKGSVYAETSYEKIFDYEDGRFLLKINIHSGRTHQIRAMLAYAKIYIIGDGKYGDYKANAQYGAKTQRLYCSGLTFRFFEGGLSYLNNKKFEYIPEKIKSCVKLR